MKSKISIFISMCTFTLLICLYLSSCGKLDKLEGMEEALPELSTSSRANTCDIIVNGRIVDTKNLQPLAFAEVNGESFMTMTDENGEFSVNLSFEEEGVIEDITISKEGYLNNEFKAYFGELAEIGTCPNITNVNWDISLSEKKEGVWVGVRDGAWYKIMDTVATKFINNLEMEDTALVTNVYTVDIRRGSFEDWKNVTVSPNHGQAVGPGIPFEASNFMIVRFNIDVVGRTDGLQQVASSRGEEVFLKPIEIIFSPPEAVTSNEFSVLDLEDLGISTEGLNVDAEGNITYMETEDGNHSIVFGRILMEVVQPFLESLFNEAPLQELNQVLATGFASVGDVGAGVISGTTEITSNSIETGGFVNTQVFSTCDCSDPETPTYSINYNAGFEEFSIDFPASVSDADRALAENTMKALLNASGTTEQTVNFTFDLDKCSQTTITSQDAIRTATGTILGFPFTYRGTDQLETTVTVEDCPDSSLCHQGCPG